MSTKDEALDPSSFSSLISGMLNEMAVQGRARQTMRGRYNICRLFIRFLYPEETWQPIEIPEARSNTNEPKKLLVFNDCQLDLVLQQPDLRTFTGYRDYVIMLVLMDTGIRIALGKGQKSRYVPIQSTCVENLKAYIQLRETPIYEDLWLTRRGTPFCRASIIQMLRHYCRSAKLIGVRG